MNQVTKQKMNSTIVKALFYLAVILIVSTGQSIVRANEMSSDAEANYKQANQLLDQGKTKEACDILQELVNNNPKNFAYTHDLAVALEELGENDQALSCFKRQLN